MISTYVPNNIKYNIVQYNFNANIYLILTYEKNNNNNTI